PVADVEDADVDAWQDALDAITHPVAQARLGDLLWERKRAPDPHLAARAACDGLLELAEDQSWRGMDRVRCLSRALELARGTRDDGGEATVVSRMLAFAEQDLASPDWSPGLSLGALRPLVALPAKERPEELDALLNQVADRYGADPNIFDAVADLRSRLVDD